jgi:hypothetical protein
MHRFGMRGLNRDRVPDWQGFVAERGGIFGFGSK